MGDSMFCVQIYFDPHNVNHARLEADNLIRMADSNNDGKLSVEEVLDNTELFLGSKMVDAKRKLHDEFQPVFMRTIINKNQIHKCNSTTKLDFIEYQPFQIGNISMTVLHRTDCV